MFKKFKVYLSRRKSHKEKKDLMNNVLKTSNLIQHALEGKQIISIILEASRLITLTTFSILLDKYKKDNDAYTAQVLASQVTNYLTGQSVEQSYQRSGEPLKSVIGKIKGMVPNKALEIINEDPEVGEMIIKNLHFMKHLDWGFKETGGYLSASQKAQVDFLLKYGEDISYDLDHDKFLILAKNFKSKRLKSH